MVFVLNCYRYKRNTTLSLVKGYVFIISVDFGPYSHYIFIASVVNHDGTTYT